MKQDDFVIRSNFTKIPNGILRDTRLSAGAKGIYAVMVQFFVIAGFVLYKSMLMSQFSDGAASFNRCWNELKKYGYLKIEKKHVNGRYAYEYELFDCPCDPEGDVLRSETGEDAGISENKMNDSKRETEKDIERCGTNNQNQPVPKNMRKSRDIGEILNSETQVFSPSAHETCPSGSNFSQKPMRIRTANHTANTETEKPSGGVLTAYQTPVQKLKDRLSSKKIHDQIDYAALAAGEGEDYANEIVCLMQDVYNTPNEKFLRIGGQMLPGAAVKERFEKLNYDMVQNVLFRFKNFAGKVQNIHAYMVTALYNEPASHHLGIHNETTYLEMELGS